MPRSLRTGFLPTLAEAGEPGGRIGDLPQASARGWPRADGNRLV